MIRPDHLNCDVGAIVKSLVFRTDDELTLCLVAGDKKASLNLIKKTINSKDVSMASAEDVKKITGYTIGGVSPVGHLKSLNIYIDVSLKRFDAQFGCPAAANTFVNLSKFVSIKIFNLLK